MKKILTIIVILSISGLTSYGQPQLRFRVTNPKITYNLGLGVHYLEYDVEVKADVAGTWAKALQANFYYNTATLGTTFGVGTTRKGISAEISAVTSNYKYNITTSTASNKVNVYLTAATNVTPPSPTPTKMNWYWTEMTTNWQTLITIKLDLSGDLEAESGIFFARGTMNNQQFYQEYVGGSSNGLPYLNPCLYDTLQSLRFTYLGRIYSIYGGWTQQNISASSNTLDWSQVVATSVWDSVATLSTSGALTSKLRIHNSGRLKILPGGQLTASGNTEIIEPRGLWIVSDATGTGSFIDNGTITYGTTGSALAQKYLDPDKWHGYCIPLQDIKTRPYKDYYMKYYDEPTHHYKYVIDVGLDSTLAKDGLGYMMWSASGSTNTTPVSPIGQLNTGTVNMTVSQTAGSPPYSPYDGWNMIGNPFASAIDWESSSITFSDVEISPTYYVWQPGAVSQTESGQYGSYNRSTHVGTNSTTQYIAAQQGFFVEVNSPNPGTTFAISVGSGARTHNTVNFYKEEKTDMLILTAAASGITNEIKLWFNDNASPAYESDWDNHKLEAENNVPQLWFPLPDNESAAVNTLPFEGQTMVVPVNFRRNIPGHTTFTADGIDSFKPGTIILLEDKQLNIIQDLVANPEYQFTSKPDDSENRFLLHFTKSAIGIDEKDKGFQIYSFEDYLYVKNLVKGNTYGTVWMYDLTGRTVFHADLKDFTINKFNPGVNGGYYAVKVITKDGAYTQKVFLQ